MKLTEDPESIMARNRRLLADRAKAQEGQALLGTLPQGHGSGLNADLVDGLHAFEIIAKVPRGSGGGGSTAEQKFCAGITEPSTTYAGMMWVDLSTSPITIRVRNAANTCWITLQELLLEVSI